MRFSTTAAVALGLAAAPSLAAEAAKPTTVTLFLSDNSTDTDTYEHVFASVIGVSGPLTTYAIKIADRDLLATSLPPTTSASDSHTEITVTHGSSTVAHTLVDVRTVSSVAEIVTASFNCNVKPTTEATCTYGYLMTTGTSAPTSETITETYTHLNYAVATVTAGQEKLTGDKAGQDKPGDKNAAGRTGEVGVMGMLTGVCMVLFGGLLV